MEDSLAKTQQDTAEFRAEIRNMFHTVGLRQEEANVKLDNHINKVEPILEALVVTKLVIKVITWSSATITAVATAYLLIKQVLRGY